MKKKRICIISHSSYGYFNPEIKGFLGGLQRQMSMIGRELTSDFDVHFIVGDYGQPKQTVHDKITFHRSYVPDGDVPKYKKPIKYYKLYNAIKNADADIFIYRGSARRAALIYPLVQRTGGHWIYNAANDTNFTDQTNNLPYPLRVSFSKSLEAADEIIVQSNKQRRLLKNNFGHTGKIVPSGYPEVDNISSHQDRGYFLWVGRIEPTQKRPHIFLRLARHLPDCDFILIGTPQSEEYENQIDVIAQELDNLSYLGRIEPENIHSYYRNAKAIINTSSYEGFPSTFLEAWRYKTPVISLNVDTGRFFDQSDSDCYANGEFGKLVELVEKYNKCVERRAEAGEMSYQKFKRSYTIETVAQKYKDIILRIDCETNTDSNF